MRFDASSRRTQPVGEGIKRQGGGAFNFVTYDSLLSSGAVGGGVHDQTRPLVLLANSERCPANQNRLKPMGAHPIS